MNEKWSKIKADKKKTPGDIKTNFFKDLGEVNPYLCLIDIATKELVENKTKNDIELLSRKYGHNRLNVHDLKFDRMSRFVILSHLAFINSRSDGFCSELIDSEFMKRADTKVRVKVEKVDKLRVAVAHFRALEGDRKKKVKSMHSNVFKNYVGAENANVVDYYRSIRNREFHGGIRSESEIIKLKDVELISIEQKLKHKPNSWDELTVKDVILYSKAWQEIANRLCKRFVDLEKVIPKLCKRYKNHKPERRDNAIRQTLTQVYLQSKEEIDRLNPETGVWIA